MESTFVANVQEQLYEIFYAHPQCQENEEGVPTIPADALVDILHEFSEAYDGVELMTKEEQDQLTALLQSNPGLEATPQVILGLIAMRTSASPVRSSRPPSEPDDDRDYYDGRALSRTSSRESAFHRPSTSRPPSRGAGGVPQTPTPLDKRQRSAPLGIVAPPSSWAKPVPASRRKSIDGGHSRTLSDSESSASPSAFRAAFRRNRAPSTPTAPGKSQSNSEPYYPSDDYSPTLGGRSRPPSRPPSRQHSRPHSRASSGGYGFGSPTLGSGGRSPALDADSSALSIEAALSGAPDSDDDGERDSDDDGDQPTWQARARLGSTTSVEEEEAEARLDAMGRANADLAKKLKEAEDTLRGKLDDHEAELEDMQQRLEEMRAELSSTKREEKELRAKDRSNTSQLATLDMEIARLQKSLESARASYTTLHKQYQEQCAESEQYRNRLRTRDQEVKDYQDQAALQQLETSKLLREQGKYEERVGLLEAELSRAQQAHAQLDEQKQENLMLKETIDRMRYEVDELRQSAAGAGAAQASVSRQSSVSRSLGAELLSKMRDGQWKLGTDEEEAPAEGDSVETEVDDGEETEGEDVIQTIITRTKKKVASRANRLERVETLRFEETKEYADAFTQHEVADFTASTLTQTDPEPKPRTTSFAVQVAEPPVLVSVSATQTEPEPKTLPRITVEMDVQTDVPDSEAQEDDEALASSSSTVLPPTPKAGPSHLHPVAPADLPPAYEEEANEEHVRIAAETLRKWHKGVHLPLDAATPVPGGVSEEAVADWRALKAELGAECLVIDKMIEASEKRVRHRATGGAPRSPRLNRFYNIYNTYVYGQGKDGAPAPPPSPFGSAAAHVLLCMGASAAVFLALSHQLAPQYAVPGGPTYYDRVAWSGFNNMQAAGEGFGFAPPHDGTAAVWSLFGRIGGGAARIIRGWPT